MFQLDDDFLASVGLSAMPDEQKQPFLEHLLEELEMRVGTRLSEGLSNQQLGEFEKLIEARDERGALKWLESHRPDYKQVVTEELDKLKKEVGESKDRILAE